LVSTTIGGGATTRMLPPMSAIAACAFGRLASWNAQQMIARNEPIETAWKDRTGVCLSDDPVAARTPASRETSANHQILAAPL
jgi:hypothetical protein